MMPASKTNERVTACVYLSVFKMFSNWQIFYHTIIFNHDNQNHDGKISNGQEVTLHQHGNIKQICEPIM
jgi:hypothetical protein